MRDLDEIINDCKEVLKKTLFVDDGITYRALIGFLEAIKSREVLKLAKVLPTDELIKINAYVAGVSKLIAELGELKTQKAVEQ